ncbi:MAG: EamA family transporter [Ilumatobacteraceae bacterium]
MVVVLALTAATVIGVGDYLGGRASSRHPAILVTFVGQAVACVLGVFAALAMGWDDLHPGDLVLGALSGAAAGTATVAFFHALGNGRMSIVAPVTAATGVVLPVAYDAVRGVELQGITWTAMVIVIAAIPMVAMRPGGDHRLSLRAELLLSVMAGTGYALYFILLGHTSESSGQWPVVMSFAVGAACVGLMAAVQRVRLDRLPWGAVGSGTASIVAGVCITRALQIGPISLATVLGSLYPVVTSGLAVRLDGERLRPINVVGIVAAVAGAAAVAATR